MVSVQREPFSRQRAVRRPRSSGLPRNQARRPHPPVIDVSWNYHVQTDIYDVHDYEGDVAKFREKFASFESGKVPTRWIRTTTANRTSSASSADSNGRPKQPAGVRRNPQTEDALADKFVEYLGILLGNPKICAFCYTQLTDVEQEVNGLYYYDRRDKFKPETVEKSVRQ
ncbi:MAG: hypothetical protein ACLUSP_05045 [Christensenellales bacterium]